jgi:serine/threonine-protein kinase
VLGAGTLLGQRYRVSRLLGAGTYGAVYLAEDSRLHRSVALKVVHDAAADSESRERLRREAVALARVAHPNVVRVLDWCTEPGEPAALVMELAPGETLKTRLAAGAMPLEQVAALGAQIFGALAAIHEAGILHRDLKPGNVMIEPDRGAGVHARIVDFGLAKLHEATVLTETGAVLGTPVYMPPEAMQGAPPSEAGDLYAAGCVLYEALGGRRAFHGLSGAELYLAIREGRVTPLAELRPDAPPELVAVIERAMATRPEDRFPSATVARAALGGHAAVVVAPPPPEAPATPATGPSASSRRRWIPVAIAAASLPLLTALVTFVAIPRGPRARPAPSSAVTLPPAPSATEERPELAEPSDAAPTADAPPASVSAPQPLRSGAAQGRAPTCRCWYENQGRLYKPLCLKPQAPTCTCEGSEGAMCAVEWTGPTGRMPSCARSTQRVFAQEPASSVACEGFAYRWGKSRDVESLRVTGTWRCSFCEDTTREVAVATHGAACVGYTNLGITYPTNGRWVCK